MLQANEVVTVGAGAYRLRERLAGSSYGIVWRAQAECGAPDVALKFINREQMGRARPAQQACWISSAANEITFLRSLARWDARHIVRLIDSGEHAGLPVMALELLGPDLACHMSAQRRAGRTIPLAQTLAWLGQINQALAKVHQHGWRYLDLKPANLLLPAQGGGIKLADFGASRLLDAGLHSYAGTASWQAPEQFFPATGNHYDTDTRTDYFALGAMFYYLVTGGLQLRFCSDCGLAFREHKERAAAAVLARHGGVVPPTLHADEAALFAQKAGHGAGAALALLRTLLAPGREARPRHAIDISRMLAAVLPPSRSAA